MDMKFELVMVVNPDTELDGAIIGAEGGMLVPTIGEAIAVISPPPARAKGATREGHPGHNRQQGRRHHERANQVSTGQDETRKDQ